MNALIARQSFSSLVSNTLRIYGRNAVALTSISSIVCLPGYFLIDVSSLFGESKVFVIILATLLSILLGLTAQLFIVGEVSRACFGEKASIRGGFARASARGIGRLIGTNITVVGAIYGVLALGGAAGWALGIPLHSSASVFIGVVLGVAGAVTLWVRYLFVSQVVILERLYWVQAMKRSGALVFGSFWRVALWSGVFHAMLIAVTRVPGILLGKLLPAAEIGSVSISDLVDSLCAAALLAPLSATFLTLFYYSLRIGSEGLGTTEIVEIRSFADF
jgi:hypothetical protein